MASLITLSVDQLLDEFISNANTNFGALNSELGSHTHAWDSITGKPATYTPASHQHAAGDVISGVLSTARLGTGTPSNANFLRGDGAWTPLQWSDVSGGINYAAGNVGIGTISPAGCLDVAGATAYFGTGSTDTYLSLRGFNSAYSRVSTNAGFSNNYNALHLVSNPTNANGLPAWAAVVGGSGGDYGSAPIDSFTINRKPSGGSYSNLFTIVGSGNVGIGTTSPGEKLEVNGTVKATAFKGVVAVSYTDQGASFTAASNARYRLTANSLTVTLPASPADGDIVSLFGRVTGCTVARNGKSIAGAAEDLTIDLNPFELSLVYVSAATSWEIYE